MDQFSSAERPPANSTRLVIIAASLALLAVVLTNIYIEVVKRQTAEESIVRYRVTKTLNPGDRLQARDFVEVQIPRRFGEAFAAFIPQEEISVKLGQQVRQVVPQGQFLPYAAFRDAEGEGLDITIDPGMRLYALPVSSQRTIDGLRPGMWVDIEAPFTSPTGGLMVLPVMERVRIKLVRGRSIVDEQSGDTRTISGFRTIGIEVTPQAATMLSMIEMIARGEFILHLRNPSAEGRVKITNPDPTTGINPEVLDLLPTRPVTAGR